LDFAKKALTLQLENDKTAPLPYYILGLAVRRVIN
jgi:hypothetical protein